MGRSDDAAYVEFAEAALPQLTRTAYLVCADWHRADDVAQQALAKLYVAWPRLRRHDGLMPYARWVGTAGRCRSGAGRGGEGVRLAHSEVEHDDRGTVARHLDRVVSGCGGPPEWEVWRKSYLERRAEGASCAKTRASGALAALAGLGP